MPDPIDWQARCIAAEVALGMITGAQSQEEVVAALGNLPDLTAARELIAKAEVLDWILENDSEVHVQRCSDGYIAWVDGDAVGNAPTALAAIQAARKGDK